MERSVKSVELTCNRMPTTTTHDIPPVLKRLPQDWEITEDLRAAWANVPTPLRVYSDILYRGLNQHTGKTTDIKTMAITKYVVLEKTSKHNNGDYQERTPGSFSTSRLVSSRRRSKLRREIFCTLLRSILRSLRITCNSARQGTSSQYQYCYLDLVI